MTISQAIRGIGLLALFGALADPAAAQSDVFEWGERMQAGQTLEVQGIVGEITTVLASGDRAEVVARKRGDEDDFHQVAVEMEQAGNRIIICAVYGSWNHGEGRCHPDHNGRRDPGDEDHRNVDMDVEVDYEVRLPAGVDFDGTLVAGDIRADGLRSDVRVKTVDGEISVVTTGRAWANSVSGDIEIQMDDFSGGDLDFNTVSGDIVLHLPSDFSADFEFSSISGDFDSDFDVSIRSQEDRWVGSHLRGTIGGGGRDLSLRTVSGDVEIRRSRN